MLVSTLEVEDSLADVLLGREVVRGLPSKGFTRSTRRNASSAHCIRCPVLDHDHATSAGRREKRKEGPGHHENPNIIRLQQAKTEHYAFHLTLALSRRQMLWDRCYPSLLLSDRSSRHSEVSRSVIPN